MNTKAHSEKHDFFRMAMRWPFGQRIFFLRHCEERYCTDAKVNKVVGEVEKNKRRGNLLLLAETREIFSTVNENSFFQTQCREIAEEPLAGRIMPLCLAKCDDNEILPPAKGSSSGMKQLSTESISTLSQATPRNDKGWSGQRSLQTLRPQQRSGIIL
jgi:hypothetical protein